MHCANLIKQLGVISLIADCSVSTLKMVVLRHMVIQIFQIKH